MAAVLKNEDTYQHINPKLVGNQRRVLISEVQSVCAAFSVFSLPWSVCAASSVFCLHWFLCAVFSVFGLGFRVFVCVSLENVGCVYH